MVDNSASMDLYKTSLKQISKNIISSLSHRDTVNIITFERNVCRFSEEMVPATEAIKLGLDMYIDKLETYTENDYESSF